MEYSHIVTGIFIQRLNRFVAEVMVDGEIEKVHVKNTGRCKELFIEGRKVYLEKSNNPNRKTRYSLVAIYKGDRLINIDSQVPNVAVFEAVENNKISEIGKVDFLKREVTYGNSRFDLYFEKGNRKGFIEVKGVTLENDGIAMFPDAPTSRGKKHVLELIKAVKEGYEAYIFFLIQMKGITTFKTNSKTDPEFAKAVEVAKEKGVNVLVYDATITKEGIMI